MFRAMLYKELRDIWIIAAAATLAYFYFVSGDMRLGIVPWQSEHTNQIPFVGPGFGEHFLLVSGPLAIALGLQQTLGESFRGTWLFLLHRSARRGSLVAMKLAIGAIAYLLLTAAPLLCFTLWAATPGTHASPFYWSMTFSYWDAWFCCVALYLGAFLCGIRPGRWYGSRVLPLLGAILLLSLAQAYVSNQMSAWLLGTGLSLLLDAWLVATILFVANGRDY